VICSSKRGSERDSGTLRIMTTVTSPTQGGNNLYTTTANIDEYIVLCAFHFCYLTISINSMTSGVPT